MPEGKLDIPSPTRIKAIRKALGLSQESFAERLGVRFSTVNRWENGHRKPTRLAIFRLEKLRLEAEGQLRPVHFGETPFPRQREFIAVAIRGRLVVFDPSAPDQALSRQNLFMIPAELGPVRSLSFDHLYGKPVLLLGTRDGVVLRHLSQNEPAVRFPFGRRSGRGYGTNCARINHGYLYATHSEHGLWRWRLDQPTNAERLFEDLLRSRRTIRSITVLDRDRMMFIADKEIYAFTKSATTPDLIHESPQGARLTSTCLFEHTIYIASSDGRISSFDLVFRKQQSLLSYEQVHLYSARLVRSLNSPFLVLGTRNPRVLLLGVGDNDERIVYSSGSKNLRLAAATNEHIVATDHGLNELFIWEADQPESPAARIPVAQTLKHHIQDLCSVTLPQEGP